MAVLMNVYNLHEVESQTKIECENAKNGDALLHTYNMNGSSVENLHTDFSNDQMVDLTWNDLNYNITSGIFCKKENKKILNGVTGCAPAGMLTAILGPSGAGKTTLLNILSGFKGKNYEGQVLVNNKIPSTSFYRQKSSYIPQDSYLFSHLTVKETVTIAANLKLPRSISKEEKEKIVTNVIETLRLTDCQNTKTNQLSGGEKKRLSIAQELVNNPPMMLLDEPTSGLDSSLTYQCINLLIDLAKDGRTIICTIHQPSSLIFERIDNLHILSKGECMYSGLRRDFIPYLVSCNLECPQFYNPADYAIDVASGVVPGMKNLLAKQAEEREKRKVHIANGNIIGKKTVPTLKMKNQGYPTSFFNQFFTLLKRIFFSTLRQPMLTTVCLISLVLLAALVGKIYRQSGWNADQATANLGFLALIIIILTFAAILPTLLTFPIEKMGVIKEYQNGWYSVISYYLAKTVAELPFNFIFPVAFTSTVYWLTGQPSDLWRYFYFIALCLGLTLNAQSIPLIIGALFSARVTVFLVPVICLPLLLFCNFFVIGNTLPPYISWMARISPFSLAYEGMLMVLYGFERETLKCEVLCIFRNPKFILKTLKIDDQNIYINFATLSASLVVLRIIGFLCLRYKVRKLK